MRGVMAGVVAGMTMLVGGGTVAAQMPADDVMTELDQVIRARMAGNNIPGAIVAVARRGEIIHLAPYGLANVELGVPVSDSTVFEIGSVSKQFVAAVVLQLREEGRLALEDPMHDYLPWLPGEWRGVTLYHLLTHTSGIPDYEAIAGYRIYRERMTAQDVIAIAQGEPVDAEPGAVYRYSNTGYYILSLILEQLEGQPLGEVLQARIFEPLGMDRTRMADPEAIIPNRASGYYQDRSWTLINTQPTQTSATLGAGGLVSTVGDMVRWDAALHGDHILSEESKRLMWTPGRLNDGSATDYGLGWELDPYEGHAEQYHYGMTGGFIANITRLPDDDLTVIAMANRYREDLGRIVVPVINAFLGIGG